MDTQRNAKREREELTGWRRTSAEIIAPGLEAGLIAGTVLLVLAVVHAAVSGLGFTWPLHRVANAVLAGDASLQGPSAAIVGAGVHLAVSAVWGVLFVALVPRGAPLAAAMGLGLAFGLMVFLVMTWMVVPAADRAMWHTVPTGVLFLYHLVFGALLPLGIGLRRQVTRGSTTPRRAIV